MANIENARGRLLAVLDMLLKDTDEDHGLSIADITKRLESQGYEPNRKTLYEDIRAIDECYIPLDHTNEHAPKYFVPERSFEVGEIMILIDAVESAGFMTQKKKEDLIRKLKGLASSNKAEELNSQLHYIGRHYSDNNDYIYTVDKIRRAMADGHPVTLQYINYEYEKGKAVEVMKHDGMEYILHPVAMVWDGGFYYCLGTRPEQSPEGEKDEIRHFRIDRMKRVSVKEDAKLAPPPENFDVARHMESTFDMYGSDKNKKTVLLRFRKDLLTQFYDHFDKKTVTVFKDPEKKDYLRANVVVNATQTFFAWVSTYQGGFTILEPKPVREQYHDHLRKALEA